MQEEFKWMNEYVKAVPKRKRLYKFMRIFLFKRNGLTYKEMYMIIDYLNRKAMGVEASKQHAMTEIIELYKFNNNNKLPEN